MRRASRESVGPVRVSVTNDGAYFSRSGIFFRYTPRLHVGSLFPRQGSQLGGTAVWIKGSNFPQGYTVHCRFGGAFNVSGRSVSDRVSYTKANVVNSTTLLCISSDSRGPVFG